MSAVSQAVSVGYGSMQSWWNEHIQAPLLFPIPDPYLSCIQRCLDVVS